MFQTVRVSSGEAEAILFREIRDHGGVECRADQVTLCASSSVLFLYPPVSVSGATGRQWNLAKFRRGHARRRRASEAEEAAESKAECPLEAPQLRPEEAVSGPGTRTVTDPRVCTAHVTGAQKCKGLSEELMRATGNRDMGRKTSTRAGQQIRPKACLESEERPGASMKFPYGNKRTRWSPGETGDRSGDV